MDSAQERTARLQRVDIPVEAVDPHPDNPNKMGQREFDLLVQNIEEAGFIEAVFVRRVGDRYRMIGGEHRWRAAQYLGFEKIPAVVVDDSMADEMEEFQLVRLNAIHGKIDPQKFVALYHKHVGKYGHEELQSLFGFADQKDFEALLKMTKDSLPKELKAKFDAGAKEIKTIDDLALLLNRLFTEFGDTLPYNFMLIDYGKQKSLWVRCTASQWKHAQALSELCVDKNRKLDDVLHQMIEMSMGDKEKLAELLALLPDAKSV